MDFIDETLVRLADPSTRDSVFDSDALEQCLGAAYDLSSQPVDGPFAARFDELRLGFAAPTSVRVGGLWADVSNAAQTRISLEAEGLSASLPRADALWRGAIVARTQTDVATIGAVEARHMLGDIDAQIAAGPGGLPANPAQLEQRRAEVLKERLQGVLDQADLIDDARLAAWLARIGVGSAGELVASLNGDRSVEGLTIRFSAAPAVPPVPHALPVAAVLMIRAAPLSLATLLAETKALVARLGGAGLDVAPIAGFRRRQSVIVIWIMPAEIFDDAGWPGAAPGASAAAARAARRAAAGRWLAAEGIGLAVR